MIHYHVGDATDPGLEGRFVIAHVLSDTGAYGKGFAAAVAQRYPRARRRFKTWAQGDRTYARPFELGVVQWVAVGVNVAPTMPPWERWVANMVAMRGLRSKDNPHPLDLDALDRCLRSLAKDLGELPVACPASAATWPAAPGRKWVRSSRSPWPPPRSTSTTWNREPSFAEAGLTFRTAVATVREMTTQSTQRKTLGLTQDEAARRADVSVTSWRRFERDPSSVNVDVREQCERVLAGEDPEDGLWDDNDWLLRHLGSGEEPDWAVELQEAYKHLADICYQIAATGLKPSRHLHARFGAAVIRAKSCEVLAQGRSYEEATREVGEILSRRPARTA